MEDNPDVDLAVLVTDPLYSLAVDAPTPAFTRHHVTSRNHRGDAWLWIGRPPTGSRWS